MEMAPTHILDTAVNERSECPRPAELARVCAVSPGAREREATARNVNAELACMCVVCAGARAWDGETRDVNAQRSERAGVRAEIDCTAGW